MRENINKESLEISEALPEFYVPYASYVIQTRALPDVRDGLKAGARFILYAQYKNKITYKNKRRKATATKSAAMMYSPHGDASIYGNAVRMSQNFSYRYPLVDTHGNNGSLMHNNDYAADRYLEMRSGKIADEMTGLLQKDTIDKWKLNYTEEEYYPTYLPSVFPNLLVNGNYGIGVSLASSIPPHNLNDVSEALIKYIDNPNISFEELYCPIDFPTGGIIINEEQVKESLKNGFGNAAIIRSTVDYDEKENELIVRDLPYMVFSANATESIQKAIDEEIVQGIHSVFDGTDYDGVKIVIKLNKGANPERVLKLLFKHTVLQSSFGINMNALKDGKFPKMFGWKELIQDYVTHLNNIICKSFEFDLKQLKERIHILEGLIKAILNIEEVIAIIKKSSTTANAKTALIQTFNFSDKQAEAILGLKLSRLANLELQKLEKERQEKEDKAQSIEKILSDKELFNNEIKKEIKRIQKEYGDKRKTKNINLNCSNDEDAEPIEKKELLIHYTNLGNLYTTESSTLLRTRRGTKGTKVKLATNEVITQTLRDDNFSSLLVFSNRGTMYHIATDDLPLNSKVNIAQLFEFKADERPTALTTIQRRDNIDYFIFITKQGMIKKTSAKEYNIKKGRSLKAINLKEEDEVLKVLFINNEDISLLTNNGNFVRIATDEITPIGRAAAGVKGIKLNEGDFVISAHATPAQGKILITVSENGIVKKTLFNEYPLNNRGIKGKKISEVRDGDRIIDYLILEEDSDIIIIVNKKSIKINTSELRELSRGAIGVKGVDLKDNEKVVGLIREEE